MFLTSVVLCLDEFLEIIFLFSELETEQDEILCNSYLIDVGWNTLWALLGSSKLERNRQMKKESP